MPLPEDWYGKPARPRPRSRLPLGVALLFLVPGIAGAGDATGAGATSPAVPAAFPVPPAGTDAGAVPPALLLLGAALAIAVLPKWLRAVACVAVPALTLAYIAGLDLGTTRTLALLG